MTALDARPVASAGPVRRRPPVRRRGGPAARRALWAALAVTIVAVYLFPVGWMLSASLQPGVSSATMQAIPSAPSLDAYAEALDGAGAGLRTSAIVAVGTVLLTLVVAIPAGFALSRLRSRAVGVALLVVLVAQMIPSIVLANALYALFAGSGLLNSYLGLILANATNAVPFAIVLLRSFLLGLEEDVLEAATLDGLGPIGTLWRIVLPLARNAVVTAAIFAFLFSWGDLLFGLTLTTEQAMEPVVMFVYRAMDAEVVDWATVMAASIVTSVPAIVLLLLAQRSVKAGIAVGSGR